jgi:hypothetical protein
MNLKDSRVSQGLLMVVRGGNTLTVVQVNVLRVHKPEFEHGMAEFWWGCL